MSIEPLGNTLAMRRAGWILSGIVIAFMVADAGADLLAIETIKKAMLETGYPLDQGCIQRDPRSPKSGI
jgi:hypothetical protein